MICDGVTVPSSSPADAVTILNVDPGSYMSCTLRLRQAIDVKSRKRFGSNVGSDAIARIDPSRGSITIADPAGA